MPRAAPPIVPAATESSAFVPTEPMKIAEASVAEMSAFHPGLRALPSPNALASTIPDFQSLGGPGRTKLYQLAKKGILKMFKDAAGRTMIGGDSGRALLRARPQLGRRG